MISLRRFLPLLFFLAVLLFFDFVPRLFPRPETPNSFGGEEVLFLQRHLSNRFLDYFLVAVYSGGYSLLIYGAAMLLVFAGRLREFWLYLLVFSISQVLAQLTWLLFPVASPRLAVAGVRGVREEIFGLPERFNPFPWGAFPSMHVGNGLTSLLFVRRCGKRAELVWVFLLFVSAFSTLYLGEHYLIDLIAGCAYSLGPYTLVVRSKIGARLSSYLSGVSSSPVAS